MFHTSSSLSVYSQFNYIKIAANVNHIAHKLANEARYVAAAGLTVLDYRHKIH